jgi:hypothetical protein
MLKKRFKFCAVLALLVLLSGCGGNQSIPDTAVYTYEDAAYALGLAKSAIETLKESGSLTDVQYASVRDQYNAAVDLFQAAGDAYKTYLTATDSISLTASRTKFINAMKVLSDAIIKLSNLYLKGKQA